MTYRADYVDPAGLLEPEPTPELPFEDLYTRHAPRLYSYLARRTDRFLAEDLTAQVFVEAMSSASRFDPSFGDHGAWLWGIATNLLRGHFRGESRRGRALERSRGESPDAASDVASLVDDRVTASYEWPRVEAALDRLADLDREALLLFAWAELPYDAIADAMQSPVGTVKSRIARARRDLRVELGLPPRMEEQP